ncbi:hypothetical protein P261_01767 [Lachnospiraceae bacterium TWA4]|nr:hypothetical protein P261_01767 [Lachnospiraceae bacterium TWA4]
MISDYHQLTNRTYVVHCELKEDYLTKFSMEFTVPTEKDAQHLCENWERDYEEIYAFTMSTLTN